MIKKVKTETKYWKITYRDSRTGLRVHYMQIGFDSKKQAIREMNLLKTKAKKFKKKNKNRNLNNYMSSYIRAYMIGTHWKVKPIKLKNGSNWCSL